MRRILVMAGLALFTAASIGQPPKPKPKALSDEALDRITAGDSGSGSTSSSGTVTAGMNNGVIQFAGQVPTKNGLVSAAGNMSLLSNPILGSTTSTITLSDNAQQNLNSLVNITAANSNIAVLLNLNVNINSTVGTVTQSNANAKH
jgi:hypothetical protein